MRRKRRRALAKEVLRAVSDVPSLSPYESPELGDYMRETVGALCERAQKLARSVLRG
jgi:hypothetical protein